MGSDAGSHFVAGASRRTRASTSAFVVAGSASGAMCARSLSTLVRTIASNSTPTGSAALNSVFGVGGEVFPLFLMYELAVGRVEEQDVDVGYGILGRRSRPRFRHHCCGHAGDQRDLRRLAPPGIVRILRDAARSQRRQERARYFHRLFHISIPCVQTIQPSTVICVTTRFPPGPPPRSMSMFHSLRRSRYS